MSKLKSAPYFHTVGYYDGPKYRCGIRLYQRRRDSSFFILENGRRVSVAIINSKGTVIKL